jgi:hypothetical protein
MDRKILIFVAAALMGGMARAQVPPPLINPVGATNADATALHPDATVDEVLDALQARGQNLKEFVADVQLTDTDITMGDSSKRSGKVWYQVKPGGDARMHILFEKKIVGDKPPKDERKEYLLDGGWALDRDYRAKNEVRYQIARPGEKMNLFQLGKGAFPLPIGQDKHDVHAMFDVTKVAPATGDPVNTIHLQLTPKPKTDFERKFSTIDVWVDLSTKMPVRISTVDRNQTAQQQTDLQNMVVNPKEGLAEGDFVMPPVDDKGWNRHEEPLP